MNEFKFINTDKAPAAVGPYSQAVQAGNMTFFSGQIPLDPISMQIVEGGIEEQTKQVLKNIEAMLEAAGMSKNRVVKATVFLQDMNDFGIFNPIYEEFFGDHKPARSTIQVSALPKGSLIEIEVIAMK
jgi:2-iminobutanoate/2-iminopropanoate deaminase